MRVNLRIFKCKKGSATAFGSFLFLMVGILLVSNFAWESTTQGQMVTLDKERMDEEISVEATFTYTDGYDVDVKVKNVGGIDVHLIQAWVIDEDHDDHQSIEISYPLHVGEFTYVEEVDGLTDLLSNPLDVATTTYSFKVVTERGSVATSTLEPKSNSNSPLIIIDNASWVKRGSGGVKGEIHLEVWNREEEETVIDLIVATRIEQGAEHSEIIDVDWTLTPGEITVGDFTGQEGQVYHTGERVFVEIVDTLGIVVCSYYFLCQ